MHGVRKRMTILILPPFGTVQKIKLCCVRVAFILIISKVNIGFYFMYCAIGWQKEIKKTNECEISQMR